MEGGGRRDIVVACGKVRRNDWVSETLEVGLKFRVVGWAMPGTVDDEDSGLGWRHCMRWAEVDGAKETRGIDERNGSVDDAGEAELYI